ncbi:MAG: 3D domain-containing protein [Bacteroidota bacterium]
MAHCDPIQAGAIDMEKQATCSIADGVPDIGAHVPEPDAASSLHIDGCTGGSECYRLPDNRPAQDGDLEDDRIVPISVTGGIRVTATAYDSCPICTGKTKDHPAFGVTSSGVPATPDRTIAVDPQVIPIGSWVYVEGLGVYRAEDTGGAIRGNRIDIFMPTHEEALEFGIREIDVFLVEQTF